MEIAPSMAGYVTVSVCPVYTRGLSVRLSILIIKHDLTLCYNYSLQFYWIHDFHVAMPSTCTCMGNTCDMCKFIGL